MIDFRRRADRPTPSRSQAGVSLLEALIVVLLASVVVLTIAYGLQVSVTTDGQTNRQQRMNLALSTLTDGLRQIQGLDNHNHPLRYIVCDGSTAHPCPNDAVDAGGRSAAALSYQAVLNAQVATSGGSVIDALKGIDWRVDSVEYWQPITYETESSGSPTTTALVASGGGGYGPDFNPTSGSQRVTITVSMQGESLTGSAVQRSGPGT